MHTYFYTSKNYASTHTHRVYYYWFIPHFWPNLKVALDYPVYFGLSTCKGFQGSIYYNCFSIMPRPACFEYDNFCLYKKTFFCDWMLNVFPWSLWVVCVCMLACVWVCLCLKSMVEVKCQCKCVCVRINVYVHVFECVLGGWEFQV